MFSAPVKTAAPAFDVPEAPAYPDEALTVVSNTVVPLLFPWDNPEIVIPDNGFVEGVAVVKFHTTFPVLELQGEALIEAVNPVG